MNERVEEIRRQWEYAEKSWSAASNYPPPSHSTVGTLLAHIATLTARVAALEELKQAQINVLNELGLLGSPTEELRRLVKRVAALEEALQNYGHHTMRCSAWGPGPAHRPCTCGLDAALARPTPRRGKESGDE